VFWWGGPGWWVGLGQAVFWIAVIVVAVLFLRGELPRMQHHHRWGSPALRTLEERYARGEVTREEFLERRQVLLEHEHDHAPPPPAPPPASQAETTIPDTPPATPPQTAEEPPGAAASGMEPGTEPFATPGGEGTAPTQPIPPSE